jgi:COP9 signalosome complex subunit 3
MILAAMKRWKEAEEWFDICVGHPAMVGSALQMEALKKLVCVQLIWRGKVGFWFFVFGSFVSFLIIILTT